MIELNQLAAGYEGKMVLQDVCASMESGKVTVLLGPNGCGKSTLLKTLVRINPHKQGSIRIAGKEIVEYSTSELAKKVAYLPQNKKAPDISALKMVLHGRFAHLNYPRKYSSIDIEIAKKSMEKVGMLEHAETLVSKLSGGMQQKVYIAMALAQNSEIILLDEPTTYLDIEHQLRLLELVKQLAVEGKTIVMVLHDLSQALRIADKVILLKEGRILDQGTAEEIFERGSLEEAFGVKLEKIRTKEGEIIWHYSRFL